MEVCDEKRLQLVAREPTKSFEELLYSQTELFYGQIEQLETLVATQCSLTAVNPLSQEMAAGALSIKIGKRPRDLLNPKAVKYMQEFFSIKDAITKRETREISALLGVTVTQVREFFNAQRTRVRKNVRLAQEKGLRSSASEQVVEGVPMTNDSSMPIYPIPLNCVEPVRVEGACSTTPVEVTLGLDESQKHFQENIFSEMRKEETIGGQVKLMEWILQIQNSSLLLWFLTNGGVMILVTWLSQAASEEQTSVLHTILKVLCHLPLQKALPVHMSAILQSVNSLRFYNKSDISNRARNLLSRWSKMFARAQALRKPSAVKSSSDAENEMLLKQSINEIMGDESWESNLSLSGDSSFESSEHFRREATQLPKLLAASADDSIKKTIGGGSPFQTKERRKVLMVEHPGQKPAGRSSQGARSVTVNQSRPLSADDIQKAKMRAQFMQNKNGKPQPSQARPLVSPAKANDQPEGEKHKALVGNLPPKVSILQGASPGVKKNLDVDEPLWKKCKKVQIKWMTPAELMIPDEWSVGTGQDSKEVEVQKNRNRRQKETVYRANQEIPCNPNEPWDREMEYDDTLTLEIPIEQLPDNENEETEPLTSQAEPTQAMSAPSNVPRNTNNVDFAEPDPQLLAELLKHPELVFALQGGRLSSDETVKLLDMIKSNGVAALAGSGLPNGGLAGTRAHDSVPVCLPSPTPSSDPVTSDYVSKNPFSRQERETISVVAQQQQLEPRVQALPQQPMPHSLAHAIGNVPQLHSTHATSIPNMLPTNRSFPSSAPAWAHNSGYVNQAQVPIPINVTPERRVPSPSQSRFTPEQYRGHNQNQVLATSNPPHFMQPHLPSSFNGYVRPSPLPYGERNEYVGGAEFESWSPENSPTRHAGRVYPQQRMNPNANPNPNIGHYNNYGPEYDQSGRQWNPSGFRDFNGLGNSKRRRR